MSQLTEEARKIRNAYYREWRSRNKDKVKANNNRYWEKKKNEKQNRTTGKSE